EGSTSVTRSWRRSTIGGWPSRGAPWSFRSRHPTTGRHTALHSKNGARSRGGGGSERLRSTKPSPRTTEITWSTSTTHPGETIVTNPRRHASVWANDKRRLHDTDRRFLPFDFPDPPQRGVGR